VNISLLEILTVVDGAIPAPVEYTALYPNPPQFNAEPSPH